jgi:exosortase
LMALYIPSLYDLLTGIWATDEQMHGPIVLCISLWLLYKKWHAMLAASQEQTTSLWGWPIIIFGLLLYALGRPLDILIFEIGSIIFILIGLILINLGKNALKTQWFTIFFMLFMIPLPGPLVDFITMPMKMAVSFLTEQILYALDYPIGRN